MPPTKRKPLKKAAKKSEARKTTTKKKAAPVEPAKVAKTSRVKYMTPKGLSAEEKCQMLVDCAKENGWWVKVDRDKKDDIIRFVAKKDDGRYKDTIQTEWIGGKQPPGALVFVFENGRVVRLRNLSAARQALDGNLPIKRDATPRKSREAKPKVALRVMEDGSVERVEVERAHAPVGTHIIDKWYHLTVTKPVVTGKGRARKVTTKVCLRMGPVLKVTADKFAEQARAEGNTPLLVEHIPGECAHCRENKAPTPLPTKKATTPPKKKARKSA